MVPSIVDDGGASSSLPLSCGIAEIPMAARVCFVNPSFSGWRLEGVDELTGGVEGGLERGR
jgi:hypothetical protein